MRKTVCFAAAVAFLLSAAALRAEVSITELVEEAGIRAGGTAMRDWPGWRPPDRIIVRSVDDVVGDLRAEFPGVEFVVVDSQAAAIAEAAEADAIIGYCSQDLLVAAPQATWVQLSSAGAERCVGVDPVQEGRIVLTNMQKMSSPVLGEHAVAMVMSLARGLVPHAKLMASGEWRQRDPLTATIRSVMDKNLLVVGLGGIGTEVARRASALGMRVTATRRSSREGPDFVSYVGLSEELFELAKEADFIVNTLPLTDETRGLFDAGFFATAKRGAYFVSVGRGGSTVTADLVAAIESGQIAGAGLDVTDPEPLPADHPLWRMENVIITPHIAWAGGSSERGDALIRENIRRFIRGDSLYNVVDPEEGY